MTGGYREVRIGYMRVLDPRHVQRSLDRRLKKEGVETPELSLFRVDTRLARKLNRILIEASACLTGRDVDLKRIKRQKDDCILELCFDKNNEELEAKYQELKAEGNAVITELIAALDNLNDEELNKFVPRPEMSKHVSSEYVDELLEDFDRNKLELLRIYIGDAMHTDKESLDKIDKCFKDQRMVEIEIGEEE